MCLNRNGFVHHRYILLPFYSVLHLINLIIFLLIFEFVFPCRRDVLFLVLSFWYSIFCTCWWLPSWCSMVRLLFWKFLWNPLLINTFQEWDLKLSRKSFRNKSSLFAVNQNHISDDRCMIMTFKHVFECDWLILDTVHMPLYKRVYTLCFSLLKLFLFNILLFTTLMMEKDMLSLFPFPVFPLLPFRMSEPFLTLQTINRISFMERCCGLLFICRIARNTEMLANGAPRLRCLVPPSPYL